MGRRRNYEAPFYGLRPNAAIRLLISATLLVFCAVYAAAADDTAEELEFTVLHTNDEHSALVPTASHESPDVRVGGFARLAALIDSARAERAQDDEPVLVLSAGDVLGGTAYAWLATRERAVELNLLQQIGYDAVTVGNHEYDYGPQILAHYLKTAGYPEAHERTAVLAANTRPESDHALHTEHLMRSSRTVHLEGGPTVGVFGLIGEDAVSVAADTGNIAFSDRHETARQEVSRLREAGADVVVALTHSGVEEDRALAEGVEGIDLIVGGHSHTILEEPIMENGIPIVQAGAHTAYLGQIDLAWNRRTGELRVRNKETERPFLIPVRHDTEPDPQVASAVEQATDELNELVKDMTGGRFDGVHAPLAKSSFVVRNDPPLQESPVGNLVTDGMRLTTQDITGRRVDVALQANGAVRSSVVPDSGSGHISFYDITNTVGLGFADDGYPGYSIVSLYLTGEELRRALEIAALLPQVMGDTYFLQFSGLRYSYDPRNAVLFTVPFFDVPIPTTRAVTEAELYRGEGSQPDHSREQGDEFISLTNADDTLYHVVTDTYILSFLPMAGEFVPGLNVVPKNANGEPVPVDRFDELTVDYQGRDLKVWETVALFAAEQDRGADGIPVIPDRYQDTSGRITRVNTIPLAVWAVSVGVVFVLALVALFRIMKRRKRRGT
ncbi:MAG: bifunctional metallophosphatase/5'-nucleotidase [Spirochaetota bacterium]